MAKFIALIRNRGIKQSEEEKKIQICKQIKVHQK